MKFIADTLARVHEQMALVKTGIQRNFSRTGTTARFIFTNDLALSRLNDRA
jgi:hypothetical protein